MYMAGRPYFLRLLEKACQEHDISYIRNTNGGEGWGGFTVSWQHGMEKWASTWTS
jgi:hypothetical protein